MVAAAFAAALAFALRLLAVRLALVGLRACFDPFAGMYHAISEGSRTGQRQAVLPRMCPSSVARSDQRTFS